MKKPKNRPAKNPVDLIDETLDRCADMTAVARLLESCSGSTRILDAQAIARIGAILVDEMSLLRGQLRLLHRQWQSKR